jgi:hypothetical protein
MPDPRGRDGDLVDLSAKAPQPRGTFATGAVHPITFSQERGYGRPGTRSAKGRRPQEMHDGDMGGRAPVGGISPIHHVVSG